jgi:hypothetical protein
VYASACSCCAVRWNKYLSSSYYECCACERSLEIAAHRLRNRSSRSRNRGPRSENRCSRFINRGARCRNLGSRSRPHTRRRRRLRRWLLYNTHSWLHRSGQLAPFLAARLAGRLFLPRDTVISVEVLKIRAPQLEFLLLLIAAIYHGSRLDGATQSFPSCIGDFFPFSANVIFVRTIPCIILSLFSE